MQDARKEKIKDEITSIRITKKTRERLARLGNKGETWDTLVNRLIDEVEKRKIVQPRSQWKSYF